MIEIVFVEISLAASNPNNISSGMDALVAARRLGYKTTVATSNPSFYGQTMAAHVDQWVVCDTSSSDAVSDALEHRPLGAVLTFSDLFVGTTARTAAHLGLPGVNPDAPAVARDKAAVRLALQRAGIPNPAWAVISARECDPISPIGYPCIVKPVDGSASWDVRRIINHAELVEAIQSHLGRTSYGRGVLPKHLLLLEEELHGPLVSIEGFCSQDQIEIWGYCDRLLIGAPFFSEAGATFRSAAPDSRLSEFAHAVLQASGYDFGPFHMEVILTTDGPRLVELNPRLLGAGVHRCINMATQADVVEHILKQYLGKKSALPRPTRASTWRAIYPTYTGILATVSGLEEARTSSGVIYIEMHSKPGDMVNAPNSNSSLLGYLVTVGDTPEESTRHAELALEKIELMISPTA